MSDEIAPQAPVEPVDDATPDTAAATEQSEKVEAGRTFTQEEVNKFLAEQKRELRGKFSDYDDLKVAAEKYQEWERSQKSELERATEERDSLKKELETLRLESLRNSVAQEIGIPGHLASRLRGTTKEELEADANELLEAIKPKQVPNERPEPVGGGAPREKGDSGFDPKELADELRGRY